MIDLRQRPVVRLPPLSVTWLSLNTVRFDATIGVPCRR